MGCCCCCCSNCGSAHSEAEETELPPPLFGKDVKVKMTKQGWFDADFSVKDLTTQTGEKDPPNWLLLDAVGGAGYDTNFDFFLKYRAKGQETSTTLGCANMQTEHDYLWSQVTYSHQREGRHKRTHDKRQRFWTDKQVNANFIIARRCRLYADKEQTHLMGRLQVVGCGAATRHFLYEAWTLPSPVAHVP